jgi:two-component system, chemotaxis family, protein-glutamate methylesterase/glutaminase
VRERPPAGGRSAVPDRSLSGSLDDGAEGLAAVKKRGGVAIVQSPDEALYASMPKNAMKAVEVDHVLPVTGIAPLLVRLATDRDGLGKEEGRVPDEMRKEDEIEELTPISVVRDPHPGTPSGFVCPDCGGALWESSEGELIRFRCGVGHAWSANSLLAEQADVMESALWIALRALEECASLALQLAERMRSNSSIRSTAYFEDHARETEGSAEVIRKLILHGFSADRSTLGTLEARPAPEGGEGG